MYMCIYICMYMCMYICMYMCSGRLNKVPDLKSDISSKREISVYRVYIL